MREFKIWPVHPRRLPDELLSSWLFRIAQAHGLKLHTFTQRAFPGYAIWNRDIDKMAPFEMLSILAQRTGRPFTEVYQSTLQSYEGYLFESTVFSGKTRWILPVGIYHRLRKKHGLVFCPVCLSEDVEVYFRRSWRIGFTVVCLKHSVWMIDACPVCKNPIAFHRNDFENKYDATQKKMYICYGCGFDYRKSELTVETDQMYLSFLSKLENTLVQGYIIISGNIVYSHLFFDVLYQLVKLISINKYGIKLRYLLESKLGVSNSLINKPTFVDELPISERRHVLRLISYLMREWPNSFIEICKKAKMTRSRLEKDMVLIPFWYAQILHNYFDKKSYGPSVEEIKSAHKYLQNLGKEVSQKTLLEIMGYKDSKLITRYYAQNT